MAISVGTGAGVLYEFSGNAPASEFVLGGVWYCGATIALVAPMLLLARRSASAWLLYRALIILLGSAPALAGIVLSYWLELGDFCVSSAILFGVFSAATPYLLWKEARRFGAKWQRCREKLLAACHRPELGAIDIDIDRADRWLEDDSALYNPKRPGNEKHAAIAALLLLVVVSRDLYHIERVLAFLAAAAALASLVAMAKFMLTSALMARQVAALGRPMSDEEIRSIRPRKQKRKR